MEYSDISIVNTEPGKVIVDGRPQKAFKESHIKGAFNIQNGEKFETWLGSIVGTDEQYYLVAASEGELNELIEKAAKIGYELNIAGAFVYDRTGDTDSEHFDQEGFKSNQEKYTVVDIRNASETKSGKFFEGAITIPLPEHEIPTDKPVVVHCAGGYRSAVGSSILEGNLRVEILDMSEAVTELKNH